MIRSKTRGAAWVKVEHRGRVAILTLNDPDTGNALGNRLMEALVSNLEAIDRMGDRVVVLTGAGKTFAVGPTPVLCARGLGHRTDNMERLAPTLREVMTSDRLRRWDRLNRLPKPLIAAVNGDALGEGCELALACDIVVAAEEARFGQPEVRYGATPCGGATIRLTRALGPARASELILTGEPFSGRQAADWGLANRVLPRRKVLPEAVRLAERIARQAPLAVQAAREAIRSAFDVDFESGLRLERKLHYLQFGVDDMKEGIRAHIEGRRPKFEG